MTGNVFDRPFRPTALAEEEICTFALRAVGEQLTREEPFAEHGLASLTLVRSDRLTVQVTAARSGHVCAEHVSQGPTTYVVLSGDLSIVDARGTETRVEAGHLAAMPEGCAHRFKANLDTRFLTVIGQQ